MSRIAIVGATGLVGREILCILEKRDFQISDLTLFASDKSTDEKIIFRNTPYNVLPLESYNTLKNKKFDFAFFSAGGEISAFWAPIFAKNGTIVIDNTNTFRMNKAIPLIVPEVNPREIKLSKNNNESLLEKSHLKKEISWIIKDSFDFKKSEKSFDQVLGKNEFSSLMI